MSSRRSLVFHHRRRSVLRGGSLRDVRHRRGLLHQLLEHPFSLRGLLNQKENDGSPGSPAAPHVGGRLVGVVVLVVVFGFPKNVMITIRNM